MMIEQIQQRRESQKFKTDSAAGAALAGLQSQMKADFTDEKGKDKLFEMMGNKIKKNLEKEQKKGEVMNMSEKDVLEIAKSTGDEKMEDVYD